MTTPTIEELRKQPAQRWQYGIDEDDPTYGFIGVDGGSICWVDDMTPESAKRIVDAHNISLDALASALEQLEKSKAHHLETFAIATDLNEQLEAARKLVEHRRIFKCTSSILRCKVCDVLIDKLAALPPAPEVKP